MVMARRILFQERISGQVCFSVRSAQFLEEISSVGIGKGNRHKTGM